MGCLSAHGAPYQVACAQGLLKMRSKLFHIRVIMKHTKIDTSIDSGSQSNLISEEVVKKLGLNTKMHHKTYLLNWISKDYKFPITKQCIIKFAKYIYVCG